MVSYDAAAPRVTINQADGQADPTNVSPVTFTVVFTETVTGFAADDLSLGGTANPTTATVTGSGVTYTVGVSGMTATGTVTAEVSPNAATDAAGNASAASTSTDNSVDYDGARPTVTINQANGQADPTNASPVTFTVVFSESVTGFTASDVTVGGTAGPTTSSVTGSGTTYSVAVSGMTVTGTVTATVNPGGATDIAGNPNAPSSSTDNVVQYDATRPSVNVAKASGQADPTNQSPINFTVTFSEPVTGFASDDVVLAGSANPTASSVTGTGAVYTVSVSGMNQPGTVLVAVRDNAATDSAGNTSTLSNLGTVNYDATGPTVTINQASTQADPTNASPTVLFDESVTGFTAEDVGFGGAGATTATVTGSGTTYNVAISGMNVTGTVAAVVNAGAVADALGNSSSASTSTDNTVAFDNAPPSVTVNQASAQSDPTRTSPINFTVVFSEAVTGFTNGDVIVTGTAGATSGVVSGSGNTYNIAVSSMTGSGSVYVTVPQYGAIDAAGNANQASTSTDNVVTYDITLPVFSSVSATGGSSTITATFSEPILCTTVATTDFLATVNGNPTALVTGLVCEGVADDVLPLTVSITPFGDHIVAINLVGAVTDRSGNQAASIERSTRASNQNPVVAVTGGPDDGGFTNDNTPTFSGTANDPDGTVNAIHVSLNGGSFSTTGTTCATCPNASPSWSFTATSTLTDGLYQYVFKSQDNAGAFSSPVTRTVTVDTDAPDFTSISAAGGNPVVTATFNEPILCSTVATGDFLVSIDGLPESVVSVTCTGTSDSTIELTLASPPASGELVLVQLAGVVTDRAGNAAPAPTNQSTTAT